MYHSASLSFLTALASKRTNVILFSVSAVTHVVYSHPSGLPSTTFSDGKLDAEFNPGASGSVYVLAVQGDGSILVGGKFEELCQARRAFFGRLTVKGSLDDTFDPGAEACVQTIALQADGSILVGGVFRVLGGAKRAHIARLNADGKLDAEYDPEANDAVYALALQADGRLLLGGAFTGLGEALGQPRNHIARLCSAGEAVQALNYDGSTLTWLRDGTAPEVWRTTFEHSTEGSLWTVLGEGVRNIEGHWELSGVPMTRLYVRAKGYTSGGEYGASGGIVESLIKTDSDEDGLPDWWMNQHFGHPTGDDADQSNAGDDASGTGQNNLFKYMAGLDPRDPASVFKLRIQGVPGQPGQRRLVFGPRWENRIYTLQFRTNLVCGAQWADLTSTASSDDGLTRTLTDLDGHERSKFYRISISWP